MNSGYTSVRTTVQHIKPFYRQAPGSRKIFGLADNRINSASSVCIGKFCRNQWLEEKTDFLTLSENSRLFQDTLELNHAT